MTTEMYGYLVFLFIHRIDKFTSLSKFAISNETQTIHRLELYTFTNLF